jgi:alginate O-acetyltransferase complex protein AlgI
MTTWTFALFAMIALASARLAPTRARDTVLLAFSVAFFALVEPWALVPLGVMALGVFYLSRAGRTKLAIALPLLLLIGFKTYAALQAASPLRVINEPLVPLGLSYLAFSAIHYAVELRRGRIEQPTLTAFLHFLFFFPTVTAGPIKRWEGFEPLPESGWDSARIGGLRIAGGLVKLLVLAPPCRSLVVSMLEQGVWTGSKAWSVLYAASFWIYFDFSGYSDVAIGVSRVLGYRVPENFNWPFLKTNLQDFWRAWHMSLTRWLGEYVYISLGGSRHGLPRHLFNITAVMVTIGLWHEFSLRFVVWAVYHAAGLIVLTLWRRVRPPRENPSLIGQVAAGLLTFHFVAVGFLFVFADAPTVGRIVLALFGLGG